MAKKSAVVRQQKRTVLVERHRQRRQELKQIISDVNTPADERARAVHKLASLPRDSSPSRLHTRDVVDGRPRAVYRKFGLSRVRLREMALRGELPGVRKASW
ncbi:30S ribosomal protein S14 [Natronoglycomyces albus]|uniref:Small ribosomal subunit protein uS14 n=1 Tax=Natronoglycomyces albus TaxID=2811108 RepID=A0A895XKR5_9ACTN|nr:30S ribosomal protein S14 [Natronoglycomyces albus]QSB04402.1 30S ribosomal protein S14 [Natronoglycomyces albus]